GSFDAASLESRLTSSVTPLAASNIDDQPMTVLRQRMSHVRQLGLLARTLAKQLPFGIRPTLMRLIRPLLAMKIHVGVARLETVGILRFARLVLGLKTLGRGETLDQRAIDRKMLAAQPCRQRLPHHRIEETRASRDLTHDLKSAEVANE